MSGDSETPDVTPQPEAPDVVSELVSEVRALRARVSEMGRAQAALKHAVRGARSEAAPESPSSQNGHAPAPAPSPPGDGGLTYGELSKAIALARVQDSLPPAARQSIDRLRAAGAPLGELVEMARALTPSPPTAAPATPPPATSGAFGMPHPSMTRERPAAPPARTAVQHPKTLSEYYKLAAANPQLKQQLDRDPTFHPEDLPLRE